MAHLDARGIREAHLLQNLERHQEFINDNIERSVKVVTIVM
jgi:hypothetical protein